MKYSVSSIVYMYNVEQVCMAGAVPGVQRRRVRVRGPLRAPLVELHLVHGPHGALHVLHAHEALVQRQVVADRVLCRHSTPLYLLGYLFWRYAIFI